MPRMNIGALPLAPSVADDSLLVMEQQGKAMAVTGLLLKNYAKQGVEMEFQDDVDKANAAADRAESAASAVVDMTVEAHPSDTATVSKSMKNGVVNLNFGLPRGEKGEQGIVGPVGPRGPQGNPGNGLTILGYYDTEQELRNAVESPEIGAVYGVGTEAPYDMYVFDGVSLDWKNNGPISGGGGGVIPDGVVTTDGGGELTFSAGLGFAPFTVEFTEEEESPLTADDIEYKDGTVQEALENLFTSVSDGKALIASAITDMGVKTEPDATFQKMAENINKITTGGDTGDATATPGDILGGKTAYVATGKVEGIIPSLPAHTYTPTTQPQTISPGNYVAGTQTIEGDKNLVSANIRKGIKLFGVEGAMESAFKATLTVTVDIGAVVTATHSDGVTKVEALCTTGQVVLELPIEGQWTVTAQRGVAQYNSVVITVSSSYSASLTAEVHIEYYTTANGLSRARYDLAATTIGNYALFGGGDTGGGYRNDTVDAYAGNLTKQSIDKLSQGNISLAATAVGNYAIFGGGISTTTDVYDNSLTHTQIAPPDSVWQGLNLAATTIGNYALFGGGDSTYSMSRVIAYDASLTKRTPDELMGARTFLAAAANENYAIFGGGQVISSSGSSSSNMVDAYNASLTRTNPSLLSAARYNLMAARAGSYVLFAGGFGGGRSVDAYDLFLVRTTPVEGLSTSVTSKKGATTVGLHAIFGGSDVYDPYLTRFTVDGFSQNRTEVAATSIENYALFGGGRVSGTSSTPSTVVDVYRYV